MKQKRQKSPFEKARSTEMQYARSLRGIAREVGRIVMGHYPHSSADISALQRALQRYAEILTPWAVSKSSLMLATVDRQDARAWKKAALNLSIGIRHEIDTAPTGRTFRELMDLNVGLIQSLPLEAGNRVQNLALEAVINGSRSKQIAEEIMRSGEVTASRATMIARTETARAASTFTEARAQHIGSKGYIWRTAHDSDVRPSHKKMEGKYVSWDNPPTLDKLTGHAGCLPNCRCYPEPVIPKELE